MSAHTPQQDVGGPAPRKKVLNVRALGLIFAACVLPLACTSAEKPDPKAESLSALHESQSAQRATPEPPEAERAPASADAEHPPAVKAQVAPTKTCPPVTADYPVALFNDTVLLRLPQGVSEDNFVEVSPNLARLTAEVESVSCTEGLPGGMILAMMLTAQKDTPDKELVALRDATLESMGLSSYSISEEQVDTTARLYQAVLDGVRDDPQETPTRLFFQMKAAYGTIYTIFYETHPEAWSTLHKTFRASASTLLAIPTT